MLKPPVLTWLHSTIRAARRKNKLVLDFFEHGVVNTKRYTRLCWTDKLPYPYGRLGSLDGLWPGHQTL